MSGAGGGGHIVLATRFGPSAVAPAQMAADLARRLNASLTLVYVATELAALESAGGEAGVDPATERERAHERIRTGLHSFTETHLAGLDAEVRVCDGGDVADQVTKVARQVGATYLVVGTRERGPLARLILGDTTQAILQRTPCPVIVVPLHEGESS
jgi:nucleotide-binding universal stress UspA family protein